MRGLWRYLPATLIPVFVPEAFAQGCAMCLASSMAQGVRAMEAMNLGILVLLVPPFCMIVGILVFTFTRRD